MIYFLQKHGAVHGGYARDGYTLPFLSLFGFPLFHDVDRSLVYHRVGHLAGHLHLASWAQYM
jgi:hypothetical protein